MSNRDAAGNVKQHANRLIKETSPYLLQHAYNPVDWYPWGPEAFTKAQQEDKPIFLSIGYTACHWCHVLAHESFENEQIAALMNQYFVNVKVDREERPDLDAIYMDAVVSMTGHGGWPMSVFLTPDGLPFWGGTYFPPTPRSNMPGFPQVVMGIHEAWVNRRDSLLQGGGQVLDYIQQNRAAETTGSEALSAETLKLAVQNVWSQFDWRYAGWGGGPKFPQPMTLEFLLRHHLATSDPLALEMATKTLDAMQRGGMYDQLGGGFHRYSTDAVWLTPHFEKMLYDNSQLARVYLHAWQVTGKREYKQCVEEVLDYVLREMTDEAGGLYSTQDADSEGEEGKFFVWSETEIDSILGAESALFKSAYGVTGRGNFESYNILFVANTPEALANKFKLTEAEVDTRLATARQKLLAVREARVHPGLDDKVLSGWNGLMLAAFAEAARFLDRADYLKAAIANAEFLLREMRTEAGRLYRSWRRGQPKLNGYLEDYAGVIEGLLTLYETTFEEKWFVAAHELTETMIEHFADPAGGFFDTSDDHETLVVRPKGMQDNATPSGNSLAVTVLLKLAALTGDGRYTDIAESAMRLVQPIVPRFPTGYAQWLVAMAFALNHPKEIAIIGGPDAADVREMLKVVWESYRPFQVTAVGNASAGLTVPLLADRPQLGGRATAYVCENFVCLQPVNEVEKLKALV